ncbi:MAG TPA: AarF/UbiB family protein [Dehalococcoidia bacterium]|nr:AarF/UbiB family protein [Dehalococcoidia bacterium]
MTKQDSALPASVQRLLAATDRSVTGDAAVAWAAEMAARHEAELLLLQVLPPADGADHELDEVVRMRAAEDLTRLAHALAGPRGSARVVVDEDASRAILQVIDEDSVDTVVLGNVGMAGRKQFLLGNVPNRVSHNARCNVIIVNTAQGREPASQNGRSGQVVEISEARLLPRAMRIGRVMVKAGLRELLARTKPDDDAAMRDSARRLREALDELGPTFAKLGQILSTRPDLLPPSFIEELSHLQERVTPLTETQVAEVVEKELGVPWEDVFAGFDPVPLAAGTIAQVHQARLETGERVVVKVQRPTAEEDVLQDLALLEMFAAKVASRPAFQSVFDVPAIVEHLSESLRRELDFRQECANIERMREVLAPYPRLAVPRVYPEYSTQRLLVMEEVEGVPIQEAPLGQARSEAARQLLESYYRQVLSQGFFHADPHGGNLKWWKDCVYFLDMGMMGEVSPEVRELMLLLLMAVWQEDARFLSDVVLIMAGDEEQRDDAELDSFRWELENLVARYRTTSLKDIQLGPMLQEVTEISIRHRIRLPASLALTAKAFAQVQLAVGELDPTLDPISVAGSFVLRNTVHQLSEAMSPQRLFYESRKIGTRIARVLEALEGVAGSRPGPRLQVNFRGTEKLEATIDKTGRRFALALGFSAAIVGAAMTINSQRAARWVPAAMGGIGSVLGAGLLNDLLRRR